MESNISINTEDEFRIYGVLNSSDKNEKLVIFVHGLTGDRDYHLYHRASRLFPKSGLDTFRFDLFSNQPEARRLTDCSLSTFSSDLSAVLTLFSKSYTNIHVVGHSIGGCVAINSSQELMHSMILWDTALQTDPEAKSPFEYNEYLNLYIARLKIEYLLSVKLIKERSEQDQRVINKIKCPTNLIFAGNTGIHTDWDNLLESLTVYYETSIIKGAGHGFSEYGVDEKILDNTLDWIMSERWLSLK
jgi:pimeloyl-ACP methyl ester carboxylesterase